MKNIFSGKFPYLFNNPTGFGMTDYGLIRAATAQDFPCILEIERLSFADPWPSFNFNEALKDLFFVYDDREIFGFIIACICEMANRAIILRVAVHPHHHGKGAGKALVAAAIHHIRQMNIRHIELNVDIVKTGAIKLYEKFGFNVQKVVTVNNDNESFYIMTLKLNDS